MKKPDNYENRIALKGEILTGNKRRYKQHHQANNRCSYIKQKDVP